MVDISKLEDGLNKLRGLDFEEAEQQERRNGNNYPDVTFTKKFQARLAAIALEVPYEDIAELPLKKYAQVTGQVFNFLFAPSDEEIALTKSEA